MQENSTASPCLGGRRELVEGTGRCSNYVENKVKGGCLKGKDNPGQRLRGARTLRREDGMWTQLRASGSPPQGGRRSQRERELQSLGELPRQAHLARLVGGRVAEGGRAGTRMGRGHPWWLPLGLAASGARLEVGSWLGSKGGDSGLSPGFWRGGWWVLLAKARDTREKGDGEGRASRELLSDMLRASKSLDCT